MTSDLVTADAGFPADAVEVGRVLDGWGIKGWSKVQAYSSTADALFAAKVWFIKPSETAPAVAAKNLPAQLKILTIKEHGDGVVANFEGVTDRNGADALRGARIFISRANFPKARPDEYYWVDLVGLSVLNREGELLGEVLGLIETGPHSVLRILPPGLTAPVKPDQERLVPFVANFVDDVNLAERRITVDWGLDY